MGGGGPNAERRTLLIRVFRIVERARHLPEGANTFYCCTLRDGRYFESLEHLRASSNQI